MRTLLLLLTFIFIYELQNTWAYTTVNNNTKNTTWSGTVFIDSHLTIENGNVVTIEPGTVIKFAHEAGITVRYGGKIIADGTYGSAIIFTSMDDNTVGDTINGSDGVPKPGDWREIYLSMGYVYFEHVEIYYGAEYSAYTARSALHIVADTALVRNCIVAKSGYNGVYVNENAKFEYCNFYDNAVYGVTTDSRVKDSLVFEKCNFINNKYGLDANIYTGFIKIKDCKFENNYNGLYAYGRDNTNFFMENCSFKNNEDKAVLLNNLTITKKLSGNTFENNGFNAYYINKTESTDTLNLYANNNIPYVIGDGVSPAVLNIYEGTVIKIIDNSISVGSSGKLNIYGTETNPVIFTNINDDTYGGDTRNDGDATATEIKSTLNSFGITNIEYAKFYYAKVTINNSNALVKHSSFEKCSSGSALLGKMKIDSCYFAENTYGFSAYYDTCYITNCLFENNTTGILNNRNVIVRNSIFKNNTYGVLSEGYYTDLGKNSTDSVGNNIFTGNTDYDIKNRNSQTIYAIMNKWDGTTSAEIDNKLYDDDENSSLGEVIFTPWQGGCEFEQLPMPTGETTICENITTNVYSITNTDNDATIKWVLSPESAGTMENGNNSVTITWNLSFTGEVMLWAYPEKDCGTGENSDTLVIHRVTLPEKPVITQTDNTLGTTEYAGYQWYEYIENEDYWEPITDAKSQTFSPEKDGTYAVEVENESGCKIMSDNFEFIFSGITDYNANTFKVYPNPAKNIFTVNVNNNSVYTITITDISGKTVAQKQASGENCVFNADYESGLYFVNISNKNTDKTIKLIIR